MSAPSCNRFIIIGGPPGAGKSTVSRHIVATSPTPIAYIEGDTFWSFFPKATAAHPKQHMGIIIKAMTLAAIPYCRGGYDVLVDFSIGPWHLDYLPPTVKAMAIDYVIICPSEKICAQRTAARVEGRITDYSRFHSFHEAFSGIADKFERYAIRDDNADVHTLAARIQAGINANKYRLDMADNSLPA